MSFWGPYLMPCVLWGLSTLVGGNRIPWAPGIWGALDAHCCVCSPQHPSSPSFGSFSFTCVFSQPRSWSADLQSSLCGQVPPLWCCLLNSSYLSFPELQALNSVRPPGSVWVPVLKLQPRNCLQLVRWSNHRTGLVFLPLLSGETVLCWLLSKVWKPLCHSLSRFLVV